MANRCELCRRQIIKDNPVKSTLGLYHPNCWDRVEEAKSGGVTEMAFLRYEERRGGRND